MELFDNTMVIRGAKRRPRRRGLYDTFRESASERQAYANEPHQQFRWYSLPRRKTILQAATPMTLRGDP